ncbi:MAG: multidrug ABC transporter ATP-binding protein [Epulopiscium sp. Nele67-Bin004]|nr:MAG: multidrug ABC transporter ATP-binding protein [Epulopiscium sp. Nele67-Bin004]
MSNGMSNKGATDRMPVGGPGPGSRPPMGGAPKLQLKNSKETISRLWGYLGKKNVLLVIALVLVFANAIFSIAASYMIRPITNALTERAGMGVLINYLVLMFILYFVAVLSSYFQTKLMLIVAQDALEKIREDLFQKMQKLPLKFFDTNNNGDLMSRFTNDIDSMNQMLSTTCAQLIAGVTTLIATVGIMLYTNWFLTLVILVTVPLFNLVSKKISQRSMKYFKAQQQALGDLNGYIEESITGQKVVKVFNHEEKIVEEFVQLNNDYREQSFQAQFISGTMGPIMGSLTQLTYTIIACIGGLLCVFRGFDIGGFTIFLNYSRSFSGPINAIFMQINVIFAALAGAERVFEVIDAEAEIEDEPDCVTVDHLVGKVALENVQFGYKPGVPILKNISLVAQPSQKIAFVGSTGAGKTTVTNLLNRFYDIEGGQILIDDIPLNKFKKSFLRENIAMVLQDTHLFTGSIMDNIRYGRLDATDEEVIIAAKTANAHDFIKKLEDGYNTVLDNDGGNLSQGQRQLLNIARAVISKAPILVLDEATSSVDTRTERHIEQALDRLMKTRTTFIIAHRLSTVRNSDTIIVLEKGNIIEKGSHDELLEFGGKYHSLYTGASKLE